MQRSLRVFRKNHWVTGWLGAVLCALAALAWGPASAWADEPDAEPAELAQVATPIVMQLQEALIDVMKRAEELGYAGRYERLDPVIRRSFDLDFMAEKATGRYWRKLSEQEQARMRDTFARFTLATYAGRFSGFGGEHFEIHAEEPAPHDTRYVRTLLVRPDGENVEINYRFREESGSWRIIDVLLRGTVSELALRRREYTAVIKRDGLESLLTNLEEKIAELAAGTAKDTDY